ncbi:MAG: TonB-dependent receptor, partial [Woeseiaceae bacterium]|nr:TonB-dependent receptor [Woeseiaceae bacterium]
RTESASFGTSGFTQQGLGRSVPVSPVSGKYQSDEIYAEFYAPIFSEDMDIPLVSYLNIEGAYRYIDNDFAGTDDVWTVGLKYAPIPDIEIRGNITESVRAPAVTELFLPVSGTTSFAADPCDTALLANGPNPAARAANCASGGGGLPPIAQPFVSTVRNASVQGLTGGNVNLANETAEAWTAGVILRPRFVEGLQWSIDYVNFDIADSIETFTLTQVMEACYDADDFPNDFCNSFSRLPSGQVPPINAFQTGNVNAGQRTFKAYVSELLYSFDALGGAWNIQGSLQHITDSTRTLLGVTTDFRGEITNGASEWQANFRVGYARDKWSAFLQPRFIGEGIWDNDAAPDLYSVPGEGDVWLFNTGFRWEFTDQISAQVNINNLFDELPSPASIATGNDFVYDNIGRFYRASLLIRL